MKILLLDEPGLFRAGLGLLLAQLDRQVEVLERADGAGAAALAGLSADVSLCLIAVRAAGDQTILTLGALRQSHPDTPVVVLSDGCARAAPQRCFDAGARGFIDMGVNGPVLLAALRLVLAGGRYLPETLLAAPLDGSAAAALTLRQRDVLRCLRFGWSNKRIARQLCVSENTVKTHLSVIFRTLRVDTRAKAAQWADRIDLALVDAPTGMAPARPVEARVGGAHAGACARDAVRLAMAPLASETRPRGAAASIICDAVDITAQRHP